MLTREALIRGAGEAAPELMQKTAAILTAVDQHNAPLAAALSEELAAIADYTVEKVAAEGYGAAARWGAAVGTAAVAGVLSNMAGDLYDAAKRGLTSSRNFNSIMKANPDLKAVPKDRLQASFTAIHRYAPEMTADPLVGGALLRSVAEVPGNEAVVIKDLINSRKALSEAKDKQFRMGQGIELESREDAAERALRRSDSSYRRSRDTAEDAYRQGLDANRDRLQGKETTDRLRSERDRMRATTRANEQKTRAEAAKIIMQRSLERPRGQAPDPKDLAAAYKTYKKTVGIK